MAAEIGYDYLEIKGDMLLCSDLTYHMLADNLMHLRASVEALTSPIPRHLGLKIVGKDAHHETALDIFETIVTRASLLGVKVVTFGCSNARSIASNMLREEAYAQLNEFLRSCAKICRSFDVVIGVESLNRSETNMLNSPQETQWFVEQLSIAEIGITLDSYHIVSENLTIRDGVECARNRLIHAHTSDNNRRSPTYKSKSVADFVSELAVIGYTGRLSIESSWSDFRYDLGEALSAVSRMISGCEN
jgi:sugar phosphate isomerase/epimerase